MLGPNVGCKAGISTYRRGLDDGDGLNNLLLVHLGTGTVKVTDDGGHTGLVAHGGSQVDGLLRVILGEAIRNIKAQYTDLHTFQPKFFASQNKTHLLTFPRWRAARLRGR